MHNKKCIFDVLKIFLIEEIITFFLIPLIFMSIFGIDEMDVWVTVMSNVSQCCILGISLIYLYKFFHEKTCTERGRNIGKFRYIILLICIFFANSFFLDGVNLIKVGANDNFAYVNNIFSIDSISFLKLFLCYGILPAFCEELFYRKVMYCQLSSNFNKRVVMLVSGILFSVAHHSLNKLIPMFLLGCILMWIYVKNGKLIWCVLFHTVYNFLELIFRYVFVLPSSSAFISFKYGSGLECVAAGIKYISVGVVLYLIIYWIVTSERNRYECE